MNFSYATKPQKETAPRLYLADVAFLEDPAVYERAFSLLPEERKKRTESYRMPNDRCRSVGAGLLLRKALKDAGLNPEVTEIAYDANGKPFCVNVPDFHFSLSHSGKYALCACASFELGCDIEIIKNAGTDLAKRFFKPSEYEYICAAETAEEQSLRFFRLWTVKESFLKLSGQGLKMDLSSFEVYEKLSADKAVNSVFGACEASSSELTRNEGGLKLNQSYFDREVYVKEFSLAEAYCCSLCAFENADFDLIRPEAAALLR